MAVTYSYTQQQKKQQQTPYSGMNGVSSSTAQQMGKYQQGYQQSEAVNAAQQNLQNIQAQKPQGYNSKYSAQLDNIMQQIQNPQDFKYEFNGDNLFKAYADQYTQRGKQASLDAMGQAAALTGGYGNSYAQAAGNQAYQQYLLGLYDKGMDLRDRAYQQYQDNLANQKDQYNMLQAADQAEYGRYRDTVGDWQRDEELGYNRYADERNFDYGTYKDMLDYYTGLAEIENRAYNTEADRAEAIRQYDQDYAEKQRQFDLGLAEEQRQANMNEALNRDKLAEQVREYDAGLAEEIRQADLNDRLQRDKLAEEIRQYDTGLAEQIRQYDTDEAYRRDTLGEQIRQANMDEAYRRDTLGENIRQANLDEAYRRDTLGEQQRQYNTDEAYRRDTLAENQRQANMDEAYRRDTLGEQQRQYDTNMAEQIRQANLDEAYRRDTLGENVRQANMDNQYRYDTLAENQRQADLDEAYRRDTMNWQQGMDARDYAEKVRQYNENMAENQRQADLDEAYRRDTLGENIRQADLDNQYRYDTLGENMRQADLDNQYRYATLGENMRQADLDEAYRRDAMAEDIRQNNQNYALKYVQAILANGQMPSADLLMAAGLSAEDAAKMIALAQATGGGSGGKKSNYDTIADVMNAKGNTFANGNLTNENLKEYGILTPSTQNTIRNYINDYYRANKLKPTTVYADNNTNGQPNGQQTNQTSKEQKPGSTVMAVYANGSSKQPSNQSVEHMTEEEKKQQKK